MKIQVVMFAVAKDMIGEKSVEVELSDSATIKDLKQALVERYPMLKDIVKRSAISLDHEYAVDDSTLTKDAEIALIPPVSGG